MQEMEAPLGKLFGGGKGNRCRTKSAEEGLFIVTKAAAMRRFFCPKLLCEVVLPSHKYCRASCGRLSHTKQHPFLPTAPLTAKHTRKIVPAVRLDRLANGNFATIFHAKVVAKQLIFTPLLPLVTHFPSKQHRAIHHAMPIVEFAAISPPRSKRSGCKLIDTFRPPFSQPTTRPTTRH